MFHKKDAPIFSSQLGSDSPQKVLNLMKHIDLARLAPVDHRGVRIEPHHFGLVKSRMKEIDAMAFTEDELNNLPFYGVFDDNVPAIRLYESLGYRLVSKLQRMEFSL
ncbi:hypothetical protein C1X05_08610 [Laceyella sacchari]|nr:hypothetical protein C1X05_08610 [Laceyella sacchari]